MTVIQDTGNASAKEIYDTVVGFVEHNTGGVQPPLINEPPVVASVCRLFPDEHPSRIRSAIAAATSRGDLFRYVREREDRRDQRFLGIDDADVLETKITEYHERSERTTRYGAICLQIANGRVDHLRGGDDE
ncbi:hypothetical protein [Natrarchaeobaculum sulfurireducens]|uniref:Uncharacterized protein n=1 Tax=Natrarchaeobaculum sulfurireducens TaxID=2044521 RepID=A0A346PHL5_9EURY|nr:hypothetical protein [Natrarchaeobaculum sulfurireducens]AXR79010.1 hypothetical protein AArc1_2697 [Natrarchaeobaculum sulfurireducens]